MTDHIILLNSALVNPEIEIDEDLLNILAEAEIDIESDFESLEEMVSTDNLDTDEQDEDDLDPPEKVDSEEVEEVEETIESEVEEKPDAKIESVREIVAKSRFTINLVRNPPTHISDEMQSLTAFLSKGYETYVNGIRVFRFSFGKIRPLEESVVQQEIEILSRRISGIEDLAERSAIENEIRKLKDLI
jgi:hypothetical protein